MFDFSDAPLTLFLIIANVIISLYALYQDPDLIDRWAFQPVRILRDRQWYRLITGGFVHVGMTHLAFNMITLFFFGPLLEGVLGTLFFGILYFGSELAAHAIPLYRYRNSSGYAAVGASGAVSGVVFGFCLFAPLASLFIFPIPVPIPAIIFAFGYVALSIYGARQSGQAGLFGRVAHEAHLGGALGGIILTILLEPAAVTIFLRQLGL